VYEKSSFEAEKLGGQLQYLCRQLSKIYPRYSNWS